MKQFLTRFILFCLVFSALLLLSSFINGSFFKNDYFNTKPTTTTIIIGDSHAQLAINPAQLENTENIALEGCPLFLTYHQLKFVLSKNPDIGQVICSISPATFSVNMDLFASDKSRLKGVFQRIIPTLAQKDELPFLQKDKEFYYLSWLKNKGLPNIKYWTNWLKNLFNSGTNSYPYIGSFRKTKKKKIKKDYLQTLIRGQYYQKDTIAGFSDLSASYLDSIINLANQEALQVIFVATPVTKSYYSKIPMKFLNHFETIKKKCKKQHVFFDGRRMEMKDEYFRDAHHLNFEGAEVFTDFLNEVLVKENSLDQ